MRTAHLSPSNRPARFPLWIMRAQPVRSFKPGKEPACRESKPGAPLGTGHAQCCHLLNPHIPEGTGHTVEQQSRPAGSLWRAFYCHCPWTGAATKPIPFQEGRAMFQWDTAGRLRGRKTAAGFSWPILPYALQKEASQKSLSIWGKRSIV